MKRIAIFLPNWIGDVVMATPAIRALRRHFPNAELVAVCKPYVADTLGGNTWFERTILCDKKGPRDQRSAAVVKQLRARPSDAAVLLPNSLRAAAMARLGACRQVVGFARYGRDFLLTRRLYPERNADGRPKPVPIITDYNRVVQLLGVPNPGHEMQLFTTPADETSADNAWLRLKLGRYKAVVGLNPGGAFGASKHWPTASFAELAQMLAKRGYGVVVLCGPGERETANAIAETAADPAVVSLANEPLSIGLTKAIVQRLNLLITTDSGPRHFAAAFGVGVVTLFGPTHIGWTETYFDRAIHLQKQVPCGPCQLRTCPLDHRCMTTLSPAEVMHAAERLLKTPLTNDAKRQERRHAG
jgi:heptosyltransferase II